jgi:hypothetical protein
VPLRRSLDQVCVGTQGGESPRVENLILAWEAAHRQFPEAYSASGRHCFLARRWGALGRFRQIWR